MAVIELPPEEMIFTKSDLALIFEAEKIKDAAAFEIMRESTMDTDLDFKKIQWGKTIRWTVIGRVVWSLTWTFVVTEILSKIGQTVQEDNLNERRTRRKKRTMICLWQCLQIIQYAREEAEKFNEYRALETRDTRFRKNRDFPSRKKFKKAPVKKKK